jgi:hypothetical protein
VNNQERTTERAQGEAIQNSLRRNHEGLKASQRGEPRRAARESWETRGRAGEAEHRVAAAIVAQQ